MRKSPDAFVFYSERWTVKKTVAFIVSRVGETKDKDSCMSPREKFRKEVHTLMILSVLVEILRCIQAIVAIIVLICNSNNAKRK